MKKRLVMTAVLAAILGGAAFATFRAPWFGATIDGTRHTYELLDLEYPHLPVLVVALLVNIYFFVRLLFTGLLVLNGGPTSTRVIAWYTPTGAYVQSAASCIAAIVMYLLTPAYATAMERAWGGMMLVIANVAALAAIVAIARDPLLGRTQTWVDDDGVPIPKKRRWIRAAPQERPLVKPPLHAPPGPDDIGSDPFRAAPATTGIAAQLVKPPAKLEAPRKDDDAAPAPKLLT